MKPRIFSNRIFEILAAKVRGKDFGNILTKQEDIDNVRFKICQRKSRGCKTEHP